MQNPASIDLDSGKIDLYDSFGQLNTNQQRFVLLHEAGHFANQNFDEIAADNYAIKKLRKPLKHKDFKEIETFVNKALSYKSWTNQKRKANIMRAALYEDYTENGNYDAYLKLEKMKKTAFIKKARFEGIETAQQSAAKAAAKGKDLAGNAIDDKTAKKIIDNAIIDQGPLPAQPNAKKSMFTIKNMAIAAVALIVIYFVYKTFIKKA